MESDRDQNWREHMLRALKEGRLTTIITFDDTMYLVTLQPYEPPSGPQEKGVCATCGQLILRWAGEGAWYHQNPEDGFHPAKHTERAATAADTPVGRPTFAGPRCQVCTRAIGFNGANWVHIELTYLDHDAIAAEGVGPRIASGGGV